LKRTGKLSVYAALAAACLLAGLVLGRVELVALGAPFAVFLVVGVSWRPPSPAKAEVSLDRVRALAGEEVEAALTIVNGSGASWVEAAVFLPEGLRMQGGERRGERTRGRKRQADRVLLRVAGEEGRVVRLPINCERWGSFRVGDVLLTSKGPTGLLVSDSFVTGRQLLRVYPRPDWIRSSVRPEQTQPFVGNRVSKREGEGLEFAGTRPYVHGERPRRINWRATTMRRELYVNEQHPEHNADVVLFLDTFSEARRFDESILSLAVRAAASLADHYLATRDRVGLVAFGGLLRWLTPAAGEVQRYRIAEALLETESVLSFAWKDLEVVPKRALTPQALVIALSPLLDQRSVQALLDVRRRGFDLAVIEISPLRFVGESVDPLTDLALRLWRLWRETLRYRYEQLGVAVVTWDGTTPLAGVMEEVGAFRRFARYVPV